MDSELEVITLKSGNNIIFKEIKNKFSNDLGIVYGNGVSLYANYITTEKQVAGNIVVSVLIQLNYLIYLTSSIGV